ncbi:hypothetical protein [Myroides injenensis]|uniref:hypothetical protein n=1 Tax=Myroides injenensis TaxID=1183151 RepID=UPI0002892333|nr:hypothetical protein [Myroides injenensis]
MKKILLLFLILSSVTSSYAQKKSKKDDKKAEIKIEYVDIKQILENKEGLNLSQHQVTALNIKNEYIKRDLAKLNSKKTMEKVEKDMHERELKKSYDLFIKKTLNNDQFKEWTIIKKELLQEGQEELTLKEALKKLDVEYKAEVKEIYRKYKTNRKIYYAQRNIAKKNYETKKVKLIEKFEKKDQDPEEEEKILSLEEIANLYKEYDEYYGGQSQSTPLDYLDIKEEYNDENPESTTTEEIYYNEEGDY